MREEKEGEKRESSFEGRWYACTRRVLRKTGMGDNDSIIIEAKSKASSIVLIDEVGTIDGNEDVR